MRSMHDVIFIPGFTNIVGRNAAADPHAGSPECPYLFSLSFLSLRRQLLYKQSIYHKINICRNAVVCCKKFMLLSYTHVISYQSKINDYSFAPIKTLSLQRKFPSKNIPINPYIT